MEHDSKSKTTNPFSNLCICGKAPLRNWNVVALNVLNAQSSSHDREKASGPLVARVRTHFTDSQGDCTRCPSRCMSFWRQPLLSARRPCSATVDISTAAVLFLQLSTVSNGNQGDDGLRSWIDFVGFGLLFPRIPLTRQARSPGNLSPVLCCLGGNKKTRRTVGH